MLLIFFKLGVTHGPSGVLLYAGGDRALCSTRLWRLHRNLNRRFALGTLPLFAMSPNLGNTIPQRGTTRAGLATHSVLLSGKDFHVGDTLEFKRVQFC